MWSFAKFEMPTGVQETQSMPGHPNPEVREKFRLETHWGTLGYLWHLAPENWVSSPPWLLGDAPMSQSQGNKSPGKKMGKESPIRQREPRPLCPEKATCRSLKEKGVTNCLVQLTTISDKTENWPQDLATWRSLMTLVRAI